MYLYVIYIFFHLAIFLSLAFKGPQTQNMLDHVNLHVFTHIYIFVCKCLITCTSMEKEIVYNKCKLTCLEGLRNVLTVWLMLYACEQKASKCNLAVYALHIYMLIWFNTCASNSQQHACYWVSALWDGWCYLDWNAFFIKKKNKNDFCL